MIAYPIFGFYLSVHLEGVFWLNFDGFSKAIGVLSLLAELGGPFIDRRIDEWVFTFHARMLG